METGPLLDAWIAQKHKKQQFKKPSKYSYLPYTLKKKIHAVCTVTLHNKNLIMVAIFYDCSSGSVIQHNVMSLPVQHRTGLSPVLCRTTRTCWWVWSEDSEPGRRKRRVAVSAMPTKSIFLLLKISHRRPKQYMCNNNCYNARNNTGTYSWPISPSHRCSTHYR